MDSIQLTALGITLIRLSVFVLYALVGVVCWRKFFPRLSPMARRLASILFVAQLFVIAMALRDEPASLLDRWLWDVHEEGNIPTMLASAQLALAAGAALLRAWLARARPTGERAYFLALGAVLAFVARDEYISLHEQIDNWERYYIAVGLALAAATGLVAGRAPRQQRVEYVCLLTGLGMSAVGAIAFEANPLFCDRWDFLPLDGCVWAAHYEESLELLGIWLALIGLLSLLSAQPGAAHAHIRLSLFALPPLWILLLLSNAWLPRLELALLAQPADASYESGLRLLGYRVEGGKDGVAVWLYVGAQSQDYYGVGYSIQLVDRVSDAVYASAHAQADAPVGFLITPDYNHIYRQGLNVSLPRDIATDGTVLVALRLWRERDGERIDQEAVASDLELLDDSQVALRELVLSADP